jgi:hypothetical protein
MLLMMLLRGAAILVALAAGGLPLIVTGAYYKPIVFPHDGLENSLWLEERVVNLPSSVPEGALGKGERPKHQGTD